MSSEIPVRLPDLERKFPAQFTLNPHGPRFLVDNQFIIGVGSSTDPDKLHTYITADKGIPILRNVHAHRALLFEADTHQLTGEVATLAFHLRKLERLFVVYVGNKYRIDFFPTPGIDSLPVAVHSTNPVVVQSLEPREDFNPFLQSLLRQ